MGFVDEVNRLKKGLFLFASMGVVAMGFSAEQVRFKWDAPLDLRSANPDSRVYVKALHALPGGTASVVLSRTESVSPYEALPLRQPEEQRHDLVH